MSECTFDLILEEFAENELKLYSDAPEHHFSLKHRLAMNRIFKRYERNTRKLRPGYEVGIRTIRKKILVTVLVIVLATLAGCSAAYFNSPSFHGIVHSDNTELFPIDTENCPETLENTYCLPDVPNGFEIVSTRSDPFSMTTIYENSRIDQTIMFSQWVKYDYSVHYNTEKGELVEVDINGDSGVLLDVSKNGKSTVCVLWDNGDYILQLAGDLDKNNLLKLAQSIKLSDKSNI